MYKLSIILPVYNRQNVISKCITSILNQDYRNIELIIVDDGSTDQTRNICQKYAKNDSRILLYSQTNNGVSAARNLGLSKASGDLVTFIDSDDNIYPDIYTTMIPVFNDQSIDIVHCGYERVTENCRTLINNTGVILKQNSETAIRFLLQGYMFNGSVWNKIFKKKILKDIWFNITLRNNEDILFVYKAMRAASKIIYIDNCKYIYITNGEDNSYIVLSDEKKVSDTLFVSHYIYNDSINTSFHNAAAERYIRSLLNSYRAVNGMDTREKIYIEIKNIKQTKLVRSKKSTFWMNIFLTSPSMYLKIYNIYRKLSNTKFEPVLVSNNIYKKGIW